MSASGLPELQVEVRGGLFLHVRPIRPEDEPLLQEAFSRMSERSVYFRFFSPLKRLPEDLAHRLAQVDGELRYALCATHRALLDGLHGLELELHQHVHEENNVLFPRARALAA